MSNDKPDSLRSAWNRFNEEIEPHRVALFRYCLKLTHNPFDAEDLVSETFMKTFVSRSFTDNNVETPLAFMARVASRLWIDERRRNERQSVVEMSDEADSSHDRSVPVSEATEVLFDQLTPEQRAVLVLKEVFEMGHREIAKTLSISVEKSRVTLHRSKQQLLVNANRQPGASTELVQRFVTSFLAHDVEAVKALMLEEVEATVFPLGREISNGDELEWLRVSFEHQPSDLQIHDILGDTAILVFRTDKDNADEALEEVWLLEESDGKISRIIDYGMSPVLVGWVAEFCDKKPRDARFRFS